LKIWTITAVCILHFGMMILAGQQTTPGPRKPEMADDRILVKFQSSASVFSKQEVHRRNGGQVVHEIPQLGVQVVRIPPAQVFDKIQAYQREASVLYAEPDYMVHTDGTVNDTYFADYQWNLAKVQAASAWDVTKGTSRFSVAILDTGIELSHTDLSSKVVASVNLSGLSATDVDLYGHGTHVAGIVAAATNNAVGVAGIGYETSLMNVKVLGDTGSGSMAAVADGVVWATDHGAKVINMSLGSPYTTSTMEAAVNYAWNKGVVLTAAAGNAADTTPNYPAAYANVIGVAATQMSDQLSPYSSYGSWVSVAAPGGPIFSTYIGNTYVNLGGTSMASPHVAGLAALVFTRVTDTNGNGFVNDEVRACIQNSADDIGVAGIGSGRINAYKAVLCSATGTPGGSISGTVFDSSTKAIVAGATVTTGSKTAVTDSSGRYTISNLAAGSYTLTASAPGYAPAQSNVGVTAGATATANIALASTVTTGIITGRVTDSATGNGITGASVTDGTRTAITDGTGGYTLSNVPQGTCTLTTSAGGYSPASKLISVTAGTTTAANFALTAVATGAITGKVTDASTGASIRAATVTIGNLTTPTDAAGNYQFTNIQVGSYILNASAPGYSSAAQTVTVTSTTVTVTFKLGKKGKGQK
jgi:thermitase